MSQTDGNLLLKECTHRIKITYSRNSYALIRHLLCWRWSPGGAKCQTINCQLQGLNGLPDDTVSAKSLSSFCHLLKTFLFQQLFPHIVFWPFYNFLMLWHSTGPQYSICYLGKGKGIPYSRLSIGSGADPGHLAVSPQVNLVVGCCYLPPGLHLPSQLYASPSLASISYDVWWQLATWTTLKIRLDKTWQIRQ